MRVALAIEQLLQRRVALGRDRDDRAAARLGFLDVAQHLLEHVIVRSPCATTGICSSMSAIGPCFISPAG